MHLVYLGYHYDEALGDLDALLRRYATIVPWCESLRSAGIERVTVVQRFKMDELFEQNGVRYVTIRDRLPGELAPWHQPIRLHRFVASLSPDVTHLNGGVFQLRSLRRFLKPSSAILWQHHAGLPSSTLKRLAYRAAMAGCDGFLFTSSEIGEEWKRARIVRPEHNIYEVMEASTSFLPLSQLDPRRRVALRGSPVFIWVGRLNRNKDPETVVRGFAATAHEFHDPRLYMIYHERDLLTQLQALITELRLEDKVSLVGKVDHDSVQTYLSAADYFVLGSHNEGSGFALLEALACGCTPIVTAIPSFRRMTAGGSIGALWESGNLSSLAEAIRRADRRKQTRSEIRSFFEQHWSYPVLGRVAAEGIPACI